jgi:zinc transport system substrate-binding protein
LLVVEAILRPIIGIAAVIALASAGCCMPEAQAADRPPVTPPPVRVVVTIFPVASIVQEVGGDRVALTTVVPSGACPHEFEITPAAAKAIDEADVVFLIARSFDGWAIPPGGTPKSTVWVEFAEDLKDSLIRVGDGFNPHIWLDPMLAGEMGRVVGRELARLDPPGAPFYAARTAAFKARIDSLDAALRAGLAASEARQFVALHPAWTYFARRYGLVERDVLELAPEQEPSARHIARVLKDMKRQGVQVILSEEAAPEELVQMVARESGARVIVLDLLGSAAKPDRNTYFALMGYNASRLEATK